MRRRFQFLWVVLCVATLSAGCNRTPPVDPEKGNLEVLLPESPESENYPSELSKLTVDGKDHSLPRGPRRMLQVAAADNATVTVEFSFWPNTYTNIIRTRKVTLKKDECVQLDMRNPSAEQPDDIRPIYVPTPDEVVTRMCQMAEVGPKDVVYDIGCGDGRLVIKAVKEFGAKKGVGIDLNPELIRDCKDNARKAGVTAKVEFREANALKIKDFSEASVVLLYLGDHLNEALKPDLLSSLKPGSRIVSHRFKMGADWPPDESKTITAKDNGGKDAQFEIHLWTLSSLELSLPESPESEHYPERVSKLTVDGKDYSKPRGAKRTIPISGADKAKKKVEFSFWPNTYTNIIRTRTVAIHKGQTVEVDMKHASADEPDLIKPIYVPTPNDVVKEMCKLANIGPKDVVYDIGCGDGRLVIKAVKDFGAMKGVGIDIRPELIRDCNENAKNAGVADKVEFREADALKIKDFSEASVVLLYLGDHLNEALKPDLKKSLKPGSRIVSHRFRMGADWPPDQTIKKKAPDNRGDEAEFELHLWTIPEPKIESP